MNRVVKYDNYMNALKFSNFTQVDLNFLMALCSRMKDQDTNKMCFSFNELRELSDYKKSNSINQFASELEQMNEKLMKITCKLKTKTKITMFVLFPTFDIDLEDQLLTVSVNEDFKFILNELTKNFTRFELNEFIELNSKYSKNLYRLLKQFKTTGRYEVSIDDFRNKMDCPGSYNNKYVMDLIIKPSLQELKKCFNDLKCEPKYARKRGKPVTGYIFTFTPEIAGNTSNHSLEGKKVDENKQAVNRTANFHQRAYDYEALEKEPLNRHVSDKT